MIEPHSIKLIYSFRDWEIDLFQRELRLKGAKITLGNRAFEILEVLVKAQGTTIDKYDLMRRLWPGAIVEENTLQFHISALRKALRDDRDLLRTSFGKGYRLLGRWEALQHKEAISVRSNNGEIQPGHSSNLPASVSVLIGRGVALRKIHDLLATSRLVTLCGVGGIGKTVLALEAARKFAVEFEGDSAVVELASVSDGDLVASAVATSLDLRLGGYQITPASIAQAIGSRRILMLLDNCEHLIDSASRLAEALVLMCPGVSILATSREPLRIPGERVFQVPPLDVPALNDGRTDYLDHSAVQLFIARSGEQSISNTEKNLPTIATICQRLDGIPLAIEFAATRAETLGIVHVAERLHDRFSLLAGTRRTAVPRQQTLRATLDWSYELLSESEQHLFRHLAIFPGGFTVAAARAMTGGQDAGFLEDRISSLVWKSLITLVHSNDEPRWRLLETTRAYGLEKLGENHERSAAAALRANILCGLFGVSEAPPVVVTTRDLPRFIAELDNVRAALDWAFSDEGDKATGAALAAAYAPVWLHLGLVTECRDRLRQARQSLGGTSEIPHSLVSQMLTILGLAENYTGVADEATRSDLMSALEIAETCGDSERGLQALYASWSHDFIRGKIGATIEFADRISHIGLRRGDPADEKLSQRLLGSSYHYHGDQGRALSCFESALNDAVGSDRDRAAYWFHLGGQSFPRARLARTLWLRGFADRGLHLARATLDEAKERNHALSMSLALSEAVCPIHLMAGNFREAELYIAMLNEHAEGSIFGGFADYLQGSLMVKQGEYAEGVRLLHTARERSGRLNYEERTSVIIEFTTPQGSGFVLDFAQALVGLGRVGEAHAMIDKEISQARLEGLLWHIPELLRLKGELLGQQITELASPDAEQNLMEAIEMSREQGALYWRLRAATSLFRLQSSRGNNSLAHSLLAAACGEYAGEMTFLDLEIARGLLRGSSGVTTS